MRLFYCDHIRINGTHYSKWRSLLVSIVSMYPCQVAYPISGIKKTKPTNQVANPISTATSIINAHNIMGALLVHTAFMLVNKAVAKSTLRSINIGCVNALRKNTNIVKPAPTNIPTAKKGKRF